MSSQVAKLKAQIETKKLANTPAHHEHRLRSQAEKERIQVETAKKMASRFNLSYRALALSAAKKAAENRQRDLEAAKQAKEAAARYQMTARALKLSSTGTATARVNVLVNEPVKKERTRNNQPAPKTTKPVAIPLPPQSNGGTVKTSPRVDEPDDETEAMHIATRPTFDGREQDDEVGSLVTFKREDDEGSVMVDDKFDMMSRITEATREQDHEEHDAFWMPVRLIVPLLVRTNYFRLLQPH